ncbi:unnamed protein product [Nesidiocoris tenuis]|uniref:CUB domain-containing protein n=1 Tax=Nesidiocoris tenuis TaxID=355587 RepID=A0A6H5HJX4_9HEMI|nr:unnamed protein product [Nesidiocoris tenuis]
MFLHSASIIWKDPIHMPFWYPCRLSQSRVKLFFPAGDGPTKQAGVGEGNVSAKQAMALVDSIAWLVLTLLPITLGSTRSSSCRVSEFFCDTGQCVALDRFCDGSYDCTDKSDEPRYCSQGPPGLHPSRTSQNLPLETTVGFEPMKIAIGPKFFEKWREGRWQRALQLRLKEPRQLAGVVHQDTGKTNVSGRLWSRTQPASVSVQLVLSRSLYRYTWFTCMMIGAVHLSLRGCDMSAEKPIPHLRAVMACNPSLSCHHFQKLGLHCDHPDVQPGLKQTRKSRNVPDEESFGSGSRDSAFKRRPSTLPITIPLPVFQSNAVYFNGTVWLSGEYHYELFAASAAASNDSNALYTNELHVRSIPSSGARGHAFGNRVSPRTLNMPLVISTRITCLKSHFKWATLTVFLSDLQSNCFYLRWLLRLNPVGQSFSSSALLSPVQCLCLTVTLARKEIQWTIAIRRWMKFKIPSFPRRKSLLRSLTSVIWKNLHRPRDIRMPGPGLRPAVPATESFRRSLMEFPIASKWIGRRGRAPARRVAMAMRRKRPTIFLEKANWEARRSGGRKRTASEGGGSQNKNGVNGLKNVMLWNSQYPYRHLIFLQPVQSSRAIEIETVNVRLTFNTFTVGKFVSFTTDGCPDGHMSIQESERPLTGGQWCGSAWGYTVYYSETKSLNLTLQLDRLSEQGIGYNFDFKLAYKFLKKGEAHLRYGNRSVASWRGDLVPGSYCDRILEGCDTRPCRIQSPNYPGVYPRNITCYYRVEHRQVQRGKHVLLAVRQRNSHKVHIKDQIVKYDRSQRVLSRMFSYGVSGLTLNSEVCPPRLNCDIMCKALLRERSFTTSKCTIVAPSSFKELFLDRAWDKFPVLLVQACPSDPSAGEGAQDGTVSPAKPTIPRHCIIQRPQRRKLTPDGEQRLANGVRWTADGGSWMADGVRWTADGVRRKVDGGRRTTYGGRRTGTAYGGRRTGTADGRQRTGWWTAYGDGGRRTVGGGRVWDQCNVVQDYLTVYDGGSTTDPVLVRLCGGDAVPDIVSSGNNMLLEFHTSPYDNPFHPVPLSFLPGFELEVQVLSVDVRSHHYVRDVHHCEVLLTSFDSAYGILENPRHSLPPNTTCRYHFQGRNHEQVWLSFVKYHAAPADPAAYQLSAECNARLRIWDGRINSLPGQQMNVSLLGDFCKDEVPRLCDHTLLSNSSRFTRPCSPSESYVSTGSELTLEQTLKQGSVLFPLDFMVRYEFVNTMLEGAHVQGSDNPCDRVFTSSMTAPSSGRIQSPRSVFYYGRGGAHNLSCIMRFEPTLGERVQVTFSRAKFGGRPCSTRRDARTGRLRCVHDSKLTNSTTGIAELWISEHPWPGVQIPRDCLCSKISEPVVLTALTSSVVEVNFTVTLMNITQDFNHFHFEGEYQFVSISSSEDVENCLKYKKQRRLRGSSGVIELRSPNLRKVDDINEIFAERLSLSGTTEAPATDCGGHPWLVEPEDNTNNFLYVKIKGYELPPSKWQQDSFQCGTTNRIIVYTGISTRDPKVVCPLEGRPSGSHRIVEVFSDGWNSSTSLSILNPKTRSFVVEFLEQEPGNYWVSWLEVSKRPLLTATSSFVMSSSTIDCPYR